MSEWLAELVTLKTSLTKLFTRLHLSSGFQLDVPPLTHQYHVIDCSPVIEMLL